MSPIQTRTLLRNGVLSSLLLSTFAPYSVAQVQVHKLLPDQAGTLAGSSVALDQDRVAVGTVAETVLLYQRQGNDWVLEQTIQSPTPAAPIAFGSSIALEQNTLLIGAPSDSENGFDAGAAYIYEDNGDGWVLAHKLLGADTTFGHRFGSAVDLQGGRVVIGAPSVSGAGNDTGAAYVFEYTGPFLGWLQLAQLTDPQGTENSRFGNRVAIHGGQIVVGADGDNTGAPAAGSASVFRRLSSGWVSDGKLLAPDPIPLHSFGFSVDLAEDVIVVGAQIDNELEHSAGAVYAYRRNTQGWVLEQKILPPSPQHTGRFGTTVRVTDGVLAVASHATLFGLSNAGSVALFEPGLGGWTWTQSLQPDTPMQTGFYGTAIGLHGDLVAVGMPIDSSAGSYAGAVYLHSRTEFAASYCFCDRDAPCGNDSPTAGCANGTNAGGQLIAAGSGSVAVDDLTLLLSQLPPQKAVIVCTAPGRGRSPLGDGLFCLSSVGGIRRFPVSMTNDAGNAQVGPGLVAYSQRNFGTELAFGAGSTRHFQAWFRDPQGPCGSHTNLTHGLTVSFGL